MSPLAIENPGDLDEIGGGKSFCTAPLRREKDDWPFTARERGESARDSHATPRLRVAG
jgi:hypothetical protein